jgi:hypothetical protein
LGGEVRPRVGQDQLVQNGEPEGDEPGNPFRSGQRWQTKKF